MDVEHSCCCGESVCLIVFLWFIDGWASTGKQQRQQQQKITEKRFKTIRQPQPSSIRAATTKDAHQAVQMLLDMQQTYHISPHAVKYSWDIAVCARVVSLIAKEAN
jgi:predicted acyl esterase